MKKKICPNCKQIEGGNLYVEIKIYAQLIQPADEKMFPDFDEISSSTDIAQNTNVRCESCGWSGEVWQLEEKDIT